MLPRYHVFLHKTSTLCVLLKCHAPASCWHSVRSRWRWTGSRGGRWASCVCGRSSGALQWGTTGWSRTRRSRRQPEYHWRSTPTQHVTMTTYAHHHGNITMATYGTLPWQHNISSWQYMANHHDNAWITSTHVKQILCNSFIKKIM